MGNRYSPPAGGRPRTPLNDGAYSIGPSAGAFGDTIAFAKSLRNLFPGDDSTDEEIEAKDQELRAQGLDDQKVVKAYEDGAKKQATVDYAKQRLEARKRYADATQRAQAERDAETGVQKIFRVIGDMAAAYATGELGAVTGVVNAQRDAKQKRADKLAGDEFAFELEGIESERADQRAYDTLESLERRATTSAEGAAARSDKSNQARITAAHIAATGASARDAAKFEADMEKERLRQSGATDRTKLTVQGSLDRARIPKPTAPGAAPKPGAAQVAADKKIGAELGDWLSNGQASVAANISTLEGVRDNLLDPNSDDQSGIVQGALANLPFTDAHNQRENVRSVVQMSLRSTIGSAFTEREGEGVLNRAYNAYADERENAQRLERTVRLLRELARAKDAMADWLNDPKNHGSMAGYTGPDMNALIQQFKAELPEPGAQKQGAPPAPGGKPSGGFRLRTPDGSRTFTFPTPEKRAQYKAAHPELVEVP